MVSISRISTFSIHQTTLSDVNKVQSDLFNLQRQISSGFKTQEFKGMAGEVERFTSLEARIRKVDVYTENNTVALSRLRTTNEYMDGLINIADDFQNLLTLRRNPANADNIAFEQQALDMRESFINLLNGSFEGRYLFGGTRTNVPPVIEDPFPLPITVGTPDDTYYQGSKEDTTLRADDNVTITSNVRADDIGFQTIFAAFAQGLEAHTGNDDAELATSLDLMLTGIEQMIATQANINSKIVNLETINTRHEDLKLYFKGVSEEIIKTDILSASTEAAVDQAVLQATFQSFARINQLRLIDFLQ